MSRALELAKRNSSGKEQYYTKPEVAQKCAALASKYLTDAIIIEPSAGTGEFIKALTSLGFNAKGYDIEPKYDGIIKQDFFELKLPKDNYFVIGNPPFGRNHSMSTRFFNHAATFANYIAFIIPKSWRKWTIQNRLSLDFELIEDMELPKDIFYDHNGNGFGKNFNAIFQIWKRTDTPRTKVTVENKGYVTKCNPKIANIALTYAGYSAGRVELEFERKPNTTKIYLQATPEALDCLQTIDYTQLTENCAFTPVFGLQEVMQILNERLK